MSLLELRDVEVSYGSVRATHGISLAVEEGETLALVGSNGAGKTSTLKAIMGMAPVSRGTVRVNGAEVTGLRPSQVVRRGVSYSPEGRRVFPMHTVLDNLRTGAFTLPRARFAARLTQVYGYFPRLQERPGQLAGSLSGGEQQMLAIARALMLRPRLLLLDEPSLGLSPILVREIFRIIERVNREEGTTMLLVEQNAHMALSVADYGYVLEVGRVVMEDTCQRLLEKDDVKEFYLGIKDSGIRGTRRWKRKKLWR